MLRLGCFGVTESWVIENGHSMMDAWCLLTFILLSQGKKTPTWLLASNFSSLIQGVLDSSCFGNADRLPWNGYSYICTEGFLNILQTLQQYTVSRPQTGRALYQLLLWGSWWMQCGASSCSFSNNRRILAPNPRQRSGKRSLAFQRSDSPL